MDALHRGDLIRLCGGEMADTKSAMDLPLRVNERGGNRVTFCECPTYFNCALETSPKGGAPVRMQESRRLDEEDLPNG